MAGGSGVCICDECLRLYNEIVQSMGIVTACSKRTQAIVQQAAKGNRLNELVERLASVEQVKFELQKVLADRNTRLKELRAENEKLRKRIKSARAALKGRE
jgi:septal ring factor EnvC (AmiA/AmiB activator)